MKFKVVQMCNCCTRYTIQFRKWFIWRQFLYGYNEGGGRYFILEPSPELAFKKLNEVLEKWKH